MTDTTTADNEPGRPLGLPLNNQLCLLPIGPHDHPDPHTMVWSDSELRAIKAYAERCVASERDCRTCEHWTPHHRSDVMHCSAALRCVAGSSYRRQGVVQLWEAAPVDAGF